MEENKILRTYKVPIETDKETGQICVSLPTLHNVADFGDTVEEALRNLKKLADFTMDCMQKDGESVPESDPVVDGQVYLSVAVKEKRPRRQPQLVRA